MPYELKKVSNKCYQVYNKDTKKVFSKCSTKKNANKQIRLLRALQYNKDFMPRSQQRRTKTNRTRKMRK